MSNAATTPLPASRPRVRFPGSSGSTIHFCGSTILAALLATTMALSGCATSPVGVRRMDARQVHEMLTASAVSTGTLSIDTTNELQRRGLREQFGKDPAGTILAMHKAVLAEDDQDTWFALAELSFLHGERTKDRQWSIMAAIYAWSYLFGGPQPGPFDPRLRTATDIYNRGLTEGLEPGGKSDILIHATSLQLPIGRIDVDFDESSLEWNGRRLTNFIPVAELQVTGLESRFRTPGIGAPLAADAAVANPDENTDFLAARLKTPVTVLVRIDDVRRQLATGNLHATMELHSDPDELTVPIANRPVPLEKEPSAALAAMIAGIPVNRMEFAAFLGKVTTQQASGKLLSIRPHVRGRIPVVFVHGTASSPARWADMVNVLDNDPEIRNHYEAWFFFYSSSSPILYSSYLLRKSLIEQVRALDPDGTDPGLQDMVVIGHSQGGLLTKMTAVHSGDAFWKNFSSKPFDSVSLPPSDRERLRAIGFVEPLPFVKRVVFICTPHRGSFLAAFSLVRDLITRLVQLPSTVTQVTASLLTMNPEMARLQAMSRVNAVDNMNPSNRFVKTLSTLPVSPEVPAHSIVAVKDLSVPLDQADDGVVKYTSAHIEPVASEKIVNSTHSTQAVPETIEEVRRILLLHLRDQQARKKETAEKAAASPARKPARARPAAAKTAATPAAAPVQAAPASNTAAPGSAATNPPGGVAPAPVATR